MRIKITIAVIFILLLGFPCSYIYKQGNEKLIECTEIGVENKTTPACEDGKIFYGIQHEADVLFYEISCEYDASGCATLILYDEQSKLLQSINLGIIPRVDFVMEDMNFDGYTDVVINTGGTQNESHDIYIWEPDSCRFVKAIYQGFETLSSYSIHNGYIENFIRGDTPEDSQLIKLIWDRNTLILMQDFRIPSNVYFYTKDTYLTADAITNDITAFESYLSPSITRNERVDISISMVTTMKNGSIFKLVVPQIENPDGYLDSSRLNLYFYVTGSKIYRIWSYLYDDDSLIEFYDDDELLVSILDTEEKILQNSYLVCSQEAVADSKNDGEIGMHLIVEMDGTRTTSRMWDVTPNGETYFYENFIWEHGEGLVGYQSGFRSGRDILELENISKDTKGISPINMMFETFHAIDEEKSCHISVEYLQIYGLELVDFQEKINNKLRYPHYEGDDRDFDFELKSWPESVDILGGKLFSVSFHRWVHSYDAAHPYSNMWTLTADIESGEFLEFSDIIKIDDNFKKLLLDGAFVSSRFSHEKLLEINLFESLYDGVYGFYLTETSLCLVANVSYVIGDYLILDALYSDIEDILQADFRFLAEQNSLTQQESCSPAEIDQYCKDIKVKATEKMPPLTFELTGRKEVDENYTVFYPIKLVIKSEEKIMQIFEFDEDDFAPCTLDDFGLEYGDFKFNGYGGFRMLETSMGRNPSYYFWIWDEYEHCFVEYPDLEMVGFISFDYINQEVNVSLTGSAVYHEFLTYKYMNGKLTLVKKIIDVDEDGYRKVYELLGTELELVEITESQLFG